MKPRDRIITSLCKLIQDAKDAEINFEAKRAKRNLAAAIEVHGEWVQVSSLAAEHAADMLNQLDGLAGDEYAAKVGEFIEWFLRLIVTTRPDRPERLVELAAYKLGYKALTSLLS